MERARLILEHLCHFLLCVSAMTTFCMMTLYSLRLALLAAMYPWSYLLLWNVLISPKTFSQPAGEHPVSWVKSKHANHQNCRFMCTCPCCQHSVSVYTYCTALSLSGQQGFDWLCLDLFFIHTLTTCVDVHALTTVYNRSTFTVCDYRHWNSLCLWSSHLKP